MQALVAEADVRRRRRPHSVVQVHADGGVGGVFSLTHYAACAGLAMDVSCLARAVGATWVVRLPLWQPLPVATVTSVFDGVFYERVDGDGAFNVPDAGGGRLRRNPQCVAAPRRRRLGGRRSAATRPARAPGGGGGGAHAA